MAKNKKDKQTNNSTQHRKIKTKQHEPQLKLVVISSVQEGYADPAPHGLCTQLFRSAFLLDDK